MAALKQPVSADRLDTLRQEVQPPLKLAEDRGSRPLDDGLDVPAAIARRAQRLGAIAQAEARTEQRARERQAVKQQDCDAECVKRQASSAKRQRDEGKKPRGPEWEPPSSQPKGTGQVHLTDEKSLTMNALRGDFK